MAYAIIKLGGRQYRVEEGEHLLVERLPYDEGAAFEPRVLAIGNEGKLKLGEDEVDESAVKARVTEHLRGPKIVVGKHRQRTGYRRRNGFRASLSRVEIESIRAGAKKRRRKTTAGESRTRPAKKAEE
ncbi:MAG: 50S ribosomal protein L21 [Gaiellales bacterium]